MIISIGGKKNSPRIYSKISKKKTLSKTGIKRKSLKELKRQTHGTDFSKGTRAYTVLLFLRHYPAYLYIPTYLYTFAYIFFLAVFSQQINSFI